MPLYEYRCIKCKQRFEKLVSKETAVRCPHCQAGEPVKLISRTSFELKGSGFYKNDYRKDKP